MMSDFCQSSTNVQLSWRSNGETWVPHLLGDFIIYYFITLIMNQVGFTYELLVF